MKTYKSYVELPMSPIADVPTTEESTEGWRAHRPVIDLSDCTKCYLCWKYCPDVAIAIGKDGYPVFDFDHCKGCGICARECPKRCIEMVPEE